MQRELEKVRKDVLSLATYVEDMVIQSVKALQNRDAEGAKKVIDCDATVDEREVDVEECCLKILALNQPVAHDLRFLIGVIKLNNDLERIADLAVNIAERCLYLQQGPSVPNPFDIASMSRETTAMLRSTLNALFENNSELARSVIRSDSVVDEMNRTMYQVSFEAIKKDPEHVHIYSNYISCGRHLERIADYCTNIAEDIIYMEEGVIVRHSPEVFN